MAPPFNRITTKTAAARRTLPGGAGSSGRKSRIRAVGSLVGASDDGAKSTSRQSLGRPVVAGADHHVGVVGIVPEISDVADPVVNVRPDVPEREVLTIASMQPSATLPIATYLP